MPRTDRRPGRPPRTGARICRRPATTLRAAASVQQAAAAKRQSRSRPAPTVLAQYPWQQHQVPALLALSRRPRPRRQHPSAAPRAALRGRVLVARDAPSQEAAAAPASVETEVRRRLERGDWSRVQRAEAKEEEGQNAAREDAAGRAGARTGSGTGARARATGARATGIRSRAASPESALAAGAGPAARRGALRRALDCLM